MTDNFAFSPQLVGRLLRSETRIRRLDDIQLAAPIAVAVEPPAAPPPLELPILALPQFQLEKVKWLNPSLGELIAVIRPQQGSPRSSMTVPIAPGEALADTLVFESPANPAERFYLPRYRVATLATDRGSEFQVRLTKEDPGTRLTIVIEPFMPPEVQAVAADAAPLTHEVTALLGFDIPGSGMKREIAFTERQVVDGGLQFSLVVPTLAERGELFNALTMADAHASLTVRRTISVAIPTGETTTPPDTDGQTGPVPPRRRPPIGRPRPDGQRVPRFEPLLAEGVGSLIAERLGPLRVEPVITEALPAGGEPLYRATSRALDQQAAPAPFTFSPDLHGAIYGDITGQGGQGGLVLEQLPHRGRHHSYYYAAGRPEVVYYLPDAFKLARVPETPHTPMLSVDFDSPDGTPETTTATVLFAASSVASAERLIAAAESLSAKLGLDRAAMDLQPFLADSSRLSLRVALPGSAGATTALPDARIDLRAALSAGFSLPLAQFQTMFDRLHSPGATLFDGEVEVRLDRPDRPAEKVPLVVALDDLAGPVVEIVGVRQDAEPRYQVTLTNTIESPIRLDTLIARLPQSAGPLPAEVQGLTTEPLPAGASVTAVVVPTTAPAEPEVLPEVEVVAVTVLPDAEAIWRAVCLDTTSHLSRAVVVKTPAQLFAGGDVLALVIELGGLTGGVTATVELSATTLEQPAVVAVPIADLVLRVLDAGGYRYRVSTVRAAAVTEGEWKQKTSAILWIVTADLT